LHSALGYRTPAEFEQQTRENEDRDALGAAKMSFFRRRKSIDPMSQERTGGVSEL
jgi:hypothetical protein